MVVVVGVEEVEVDRLVVHHMVAEAAEEAYLVSVDQELVVVEAYQEILGN